MRAAMGRENVLHGQIQERAQLFEEGTAEVQKMTIARDLLR